MIYWQDSPVLEEIAADSRVLEEIAADSRVLEEIAAVYFPLDLLFLYILVLYIDKAIISFV
jgi:hypothetical protein